MVIVGIIASPYLVYFAYVNRKAINKIRKDAARPSIRTGTHWNDQKVIDRIWSSKSGQVYCQTLEYQKREGYCAPTTIRCILKSLPFFNAADLPEAKSGPSIPAKVAPQIDALTNGKTKSQVVLGSEGYEKFLETIKKVNDPRYRIGLNFLRSPVFGYLQPSYIPANYVLTLFGGHFSPIVGYDEKEDLVAVFDVNHNYGMFLVKSERLWDAVNTFDFSAKGTRGLVLVEIL
jgi:hypothetical protein